MQNPRPLSQSFIIQVRSPEEEEEEAEESASTKLNLSAMKIFSRFRKIVMKLLFSIPSSSSATTRRKRNSGNASCDRFEPPKTSCSSYYSSHSHYNEAISDCIEFFNKSSHDDHDAAAIGAISDDLDQFGCHMV